MSWTATGRCTITSTERGPVLIMLHGSGPGVSGWSNFRGNLHVFAKEYRTIVLDMPGFGRSPQGSLDRRYPHVAADAVATLMDRLDIPTAHFLGNSMGGVVVMQFALSHSERADRLVLMGPRRDQRHRPAGQRGLAAAR
jgi:4,5:9,10-diseco-3-hydroxy-5,9,17-trioxoandrosta-1(10),2-diene-4-oate hydrolase